MNNVCDTIRVESTDALTGANGSSIRRATVGAILTLPAVALLIVMLFLSIGHARLSDTGSKVIITLIYSLLIGTPSAIALTWMSFRWSTRLGRFIIPMQSLVLICSAIIGSWGAAFVLTYLHIIGVQSPWREFRGSLPFSLLITLMVGLSMTTYQTLRYKLHSAALELRTRQVEQERANKLLAEARLSSLESRIHPHFLFNTLNSIAALIPVDPKRAEDTVGKLASLLRFSLNTAPTGLVPLAQEVKIVRDYLEIERTRFGARLRYEVDIPEALAYVKTPPLALQSLVENAVKHVASRRPEGATIRVTAARREGRMRVEVLDDGPGFSLGSVTPEHGLGNLVGRLELLFGERGQLSVSRRDGLTVVSLEYPLE